MNRRVFVAILACTSCGRSQGVPDKDLGELVVAPKPNVKPIDVTLAAKDPAELARALLLSHQAIGAALGPHTVAITTTNSVTEAGKSVSALDDKTQLELGDHGIYHAVYTNSADYGREAIFIGGKLYLRPRYQRWHERAPEAPDEPEQLRDAFYAAIGATWDLVAPGAELVDQGATEVAGRAGRKIVVNLAASPKPPPTEPLAQRKWREHRTITSLYGEIVLDAQTGVPLSVRLQGTIGFSRDGRQFVMKLSVGSEVTGIGQAVAITTPPADEVVATPERLREVDDRDFLLRGIAPPLRKNADGTAAIPVPAAPPPATAKLPGSHSTKP